MHVMHALFLKQKMVPLHNFLLSFFVDVYQVAAMSSLTGSGTPCNLSDTQQYYTKWYNALQKTI